MSFSDVMYGPLGQVNNMFQANLAGNAAAAQGQAGQAANIANQGAINQAALNNAYGPQGFGGATAANAYAGAAAGRETGGFGGYGSANADPFTPVSDPGGLALTPGGGVDPNNAGNIAIWNQIMGGGGAQPFNDYGGGANAGGFSPSPNYPGGNNPSPMDQYNNGGYNPYSPQSYAPSSQGNVGGGLAMLPGGGVDPNNADNIAAYYRIMGGGGFSGQGMGQLFDPASYSGSQGAVDAVQKAGTGGFAVGQTPQVPYDNNSPFGANQFAPVSTGDPGGLVMLPGGGVDPNNASNIARYYQLMGGGGNQSYLGAGGTENSYNPFGQINSGQVGGQDAFMGYQPDEFDVQSAVWQHTGAGQRPRLLRQHLRRCQLAAAGL